MTDRAHTRSALPELAADLDELLAVSDAHLATGRALAGYLSRALDCGAVTETEIKEQTGLDRSQLQFVRRSGTVPS